jgi:hypothetical protein
MKLQNLIHILMGIVCIGLLPNTQAVSPPPDGGYPGFNTAEGDNALKSLNTAAGVGNTAVGWLSLFSDVEGGFNTAIGVGTLALNTGGSNTGIGAAALILNTGGERNTAVGTGAMVNNNVGNDNSAFGAFALNNNVDGSANTAVGFQALMTNSGGNGNTAIGADALFTNTGSENTAVGDTALVFNNSGSSNTATGALALFNNTIGNQNIAYGNGALFNNIEGSSNTAIGDSALLFATGNDNIGVGASAGSGVTTADNVICIGAAGSDQNNSCYIGNIFAQEVALDGVAVLVDSLGKLGVQISSRRFKEEIQPMDKASEVILALKPVTFHYKSDAKNTPCFGLIAEDVAEVNPNLVVRDKNGEILTVRYDQVNAMLLNEFLKAHNKMEEQEATIAQLKQELQATAAEQQKQIEALTAGLQKVSAQFEASKPTAQVVNNNQ